MMLFYMLQGAEKPYIKSNITTHLLLSAHISAFTFSQILFLR